MVSNISIVLSCRTDIHTHVDIVYTYTSTTVLGLKLINYRRFDQRSSVLLFVWVKMTSSQLQQDMGI